MLYIDITRLYHNNRLGKTNTGVDKVSLAYVKEYASIANAVIRLPSHWLFFPKQRSGQLFDALLADDKIHISYFEKKIYDKPCFKGKNFLLNTSHSGLEKSSYLENMKHYGLQGIYFLHDLIPIDYPEYCREGEYYKHFQRLLCMAKGDLIIANSQYTYERWQAFCQKFDIVSPKVIWAHLGVASPNFKPLALEDENLIKLVLQEKSYFLILSTIESRKNHLFLLNLWRSLLEKLGDACPKLVIAGKRGWECEQVIDILDRSLDLKKVVLELNHCDDGQIQYLVQHTQALLFPSHVEGFGLPLIEASRYSKPIIANDIPIFKELNLDNVQLISTLDGIAWQTAIEKLVHCREVKANLDKGCIERFSWYQHFAKVKPHIAQILS